jgi:hypothetical protein
MKKFSHLIFLAGIMLVCKAAYSQGTDSSLSLNSLKAPTSPGSLLLGVSSSEIQKPTDLTGLWVSIRNATNDFTSMPSAFAIDLAPKWLLGKKSISLDDYFSNKVGKNISQSFTISYAQVSQKDSSYDGLKQGIGIKFSMLRGKIADQKYKGKIDLARDFHRREFELEQEYTRTHTPFDSLAEVKILKLKMRDPAVSTEEKILINQNLQELQTKYNNDRDKAVKEISQDSYSALKEELEETITPVRKGFILDVSAGAIVKYNGYKINSSSLTNSSVWLTFGYDGFKTDTADNSYFSILALSRLIIDNADELYSSGNDTRYTSWDNGARLVFNTANQKFSISGEIISRRLFNTPSGASSVFKYLISAELQVGKNQRLSFTYGKDFENHITKDGNVIGLLNFVTGFFSKKTITR